MQGLADWNLFGSLTFDPKRTRADGRPAWGNDSRGPSWESVSKAVRRWHRVASRRLGQEFVSVVAIETHKSGWPHCHPLIALPGGLSQGDPNLALGKREIETLGQTWYQMAGYAPLEVPHSREAVAAYASKYVVKELDRGDVLFLGPLKRVQESRMRNY